MFTTATARHGPESEYLENGANGFVVSDDPAAYADAVIGLLQDGERYAALCAGAAAASHRYTLDHMVDNFVQGILASLGGRRRPADTTRHASL